MGPSPVSIFHSLTNMKQQPIPLVDLNKGWRSLKNEIDKAIKNVLSAGKFILGENVASFEREFAQYLGVSYAVGVASGTDALILSLKALGIKSGDEVIMPVNAYPTAFAVWATGAKIRLVDIDLLTFNIDPSKIEKAITSRTRAIIPVHMYGQAADMEPISNIAKKHKLFLIEDVAQAHGAVYKGKKLGTLGDVGCFSFYPTKNLGCLGDGGLVVTKNYKIAQDIRELRMYGEKKRYQSERKSTHSRLDELQAAILRVKLKKLDLWNQKRNQIAKWYREELKNTEVILPQEKSSGSHVYHLFVIRTRERDRLRKFLIKNRVETGIHYPLPIHLVKAFSDLGYRKGDFPEAEKTSRQILSLPCYPELTRPQVGRICKLIKNFLKLKSL